MRFTGKIVIVTGASSGIGAATAVLFAGEGARVALVARNEAKLSDVAQQCSAHGDQPLIIKADLSNEEEAKTIVEKTVNHFGQLDILVNNAGFTKNGSLLDGTFLEAYDVLMKTNLRAVIQLTSLAAPHLIKAKGNIVQVSSVASVDTRFTPQGAPYCVSKGGLDHFTRCAAKELAASGVRVNSVNPGPVKTDIFDNAGLSNPDGIWEYYKKSAALSRIGETEEIGELIMFLASDKAMNITGSLYVSDSGYLLRA